MKQRQVKDIDLNSSKETKELDLNTSTTSKSTKADTTVDSTKTTIKAENLEVKLPSEMSSGGGSGSEHSFYTRKAPKKDKWYKKTWTKVAAGTVAAGLIFTTVFTPIWYCVIIPGALGGDDTNITFPGYDDDFVKWVEGNVNSDLTQEVETLKDLSVEWAFDTLADANYIDNASKIKSRAEEDAQNTIDAEKDALRDQYGSSWETEWYKSLVGKGFDSEEEYKSSLISETLKTEIINVYTSNIYELVPNTEANYYMSTSEFNTTGNYWAISNDEFSSTNEDSNASLDIEKYMELYLWLVQPITASTYSTLFTMTNAGEAAGLKYGSFVFATTDDLKNLWLITRDMLYAYDDTFVDGNAATVANADKFDFSDYTTSTDGIKSMNSLSFTAGQPLTVSMYYALMYGTSSAGTASYQLSEAQSADFLWNVNEAIGEVVTTDSTPSHWAGYDVTGEEGTLSTTYDQNQALTEVQSDDFALSINTNNLIEIGDNLAFNTSDDGNATAGNEISWSDVFAPNGTIENGRAQTIGLTLPTVTWGNVDDNILLTLNETGLSFTKMEMVHPDETRNGFFSPAVTTDSNVYYDTDSNGSANQGGYDGTLDGSYTAYHDQSLSVIGERMLISDLNYKADDKYSNNTIPTYGVVDAFTTWFTSNIETFILNQALVQVEFWNDYVGGESVSETDYVKGDYDRDGTTELGEDDDGDGVYEVIGEDLQLIVNTFYNTIYQGYLSASMATFDSIQAHVEDNPTVYDQSTDWDAYWTTFQSTIMTMSHTYGVGTDFDYQTIDEMLVSLQTNGKLEV